MQRQQLLTERLQQAFSPVYLDVINESRNHRGPADAETHFKCVIVADCFVGKRQVQRHQSVYALVNDEIQKGLHALALHTYSPEEWAEVQQAPASPVCQSKK